MFEPWPGARTLCGVLGQDTLSLTVPLSTRSDGLLTRYRLFSEDVNVMDQHPVQGGNAVADGRAGVFAEVSIMSLLQHSINSTRGAALCIVERKNTSDCRIR